VRYVGSSSFSAKQIVEAQWAAQRRNLKRFVSEQPPYSILVRGIEEDILPTTQRHGMGTLTHSPLGGGWLSGSCMRIREHRQPHPVTSTTAVHTRPSALAAAQRGQFILDANQPGTRRRAPVTMP
jgi:aryl-alcohol dehydrogenase-like predicted oxidoreductase